MIFPKHDCSLTLEHNGYKDYYYTIEQAVSEEDEVGGGWIQGEREKALKIGEIWSLQWYPHTPIGFHRLVAASLEKLLAVAMTP